VCGTAGFFVAEFPVVAVASIGFHRFKTALSKASDTIGLSRIDGWCASGKAIKIAGLFRDF
jgi:hypothetical protein